MRWEAETTDETRIEIRTRTGNTLDEEIFYYDKNGREIPQGRWNKLPGQPEIARSKSGESRLRLERVEFGLQGIGGSLPLAHTAKVRPNGGAATDRRPPSGTDVARDCPRFRRIRSSAAGFSPAYLPREAALDSLTVFTFRLGGRTRPADRGFDRLVFDLPNPLEGEVQLRIGDRRVESLQVEASGDSVVIELARTGARGQYRSRAAVAPVGRCGCF